MSTNATDMETPGGSFGQLPLPGELDLIADYGEGAWLVDIRGRRYLDFVLTSGPLLLGTPTRPW